MVVLEPAWPFFLSAETDLIYVNANNKIEIGHPEVRLTRGLLLALVLIIVPLVVLATLVLREFDYESGTTMRTKRRTRRHPMQTTNQDTSC
jgi:hypothetical protein